MARIYLIFFLSGISGLIYEVVWLRMLTRVLGCTVYATSIILAAFMAGLAIGSYLIGKYGGKVKDQMRLYATLEAGIGISAMALTFLLNLLVPVYKAVYSMAGGQRLGLTIFQSITMFLIFLIPTILMGGTLPIISSYTRRCEKALAKRLGYLYGLNTFGAVAGVLAAGFYLIGSSGETRTLLIGALINLAVALTAFAIARNDDLSGGAARCAQEGASPASSSPSLPDHSVGVRKLVLAAYCLNGFIMMAYEVIWTRIFQIQVGTSIYAFSLMLAFYLLGIALGSVAGGRFANRINNPLAVFGISQLFISTYAVSGLYIFTVFSASFSWSEIIPANVLLMPQLIIVPITFISGFIFPVISRIYIKDEAGVSRGVGLLYSMNTLGCILGSLICGFALVGSLGTRNTILLLSALGAFAGVTVYFKASSGIRGLKMKIAIAGLLSGALILGAMSPDPFMTAVHERMKIFLRGPSDEATLLYHKEAARATTTVFSYKHGPLSKQLLINGVGMTKLCIETKLMAHLPILLARDPEDVLVICFGMGTALRSAWAHKTLKCDVVELVEEEYECFKYFHADGPRILADPRVRHFTDDGRNFLLMRDKKYDVITLDPSPPLYSAGSVNLYSKEFFELCRSRLKEEGIMCLWIPPDSATEVRMIMKTFYTVFPNTYVCGGPYYGGFFMLGFMSESRPDVSRLIRDEKEKDVVDDLNEWDTSDKPSMSRLLVLKPPELAKFVEGAPVITDDRPYTEFFLWRALFDKFYKYQLNAKSLVDWRDDRLKGPKK